MFPVTVKGALTRRRGKVLVGPVDLELDGQGATVVIGPNGSGKTSLLGMLHGTARLNAGEITWNCPLEEARRAQAFVFQRPVMLRRTVRENLAYPLRMRGAPRSESQSQVEDWAARVGLDDLIDRPALGLSGGEQQKLALARALIVQPRLLFLDEPSAALDGRATKVIEDVLMEAKARGTCLVLSTHDMGQARRLSDRVVFLLNGAVHETGPAAAFFDGPKTEAAQAFLRGDIVE